MNWIASFLLSYTGEAALLILGTCLLLLGFRANGTIERRSNLAWSAVTIFCCAVGLSAIAFAMHGLLFHGKWPLANA
jgi:hypothetical protein